MNIDAEVLKENLAHLIKSCIHHDQVCFIPGIQGLFNIQKSITVILQGKIKKEKSHGRTRFRKRIT